MATRAILRRRKSLLNALCQPSGSSRSFSSLELGQSSSSVPNSSQSSWSAVLHCLNSETKKEEKSSLICKDRLQFFTSAGLLRTDLGGNPAFRLVHGLPYYGSSSLGANWLSYSVRYLSTAAAAGQPEFSDGSEGSQMSEKAIMRRIWASLLGVGPALRVIASMSRENWANKMQHRNWKGHLKFALQHYWLGTKLLWADARISSRLLGKLASGNSLSRRERQQFIRTTADIFRLVPFAVFIIVPFSKFLLPVFLKLFPKMLPSSFTEQCDTFASFKDKKRKLNARIEYTKFLMETAQVIAKEVQNSPSGQVKQTAEDLDEFMSKVRSGEDVFYQEMLGFAKLFDDELTLDNVSRPHLVNMCKDMGIEPFGPDAYLRFVLRNKLRMIKEVDKVIQPESLEEEELRQACGDRGLIALLSVKEMRQQLHDWLDLSLNHSVPSSLIILTRAFNVSRKSKPEEVVKFAIFSLPDMVVDTVAATSLPSKDTVAERRRKLEFLKMQEELIKEEEEKRKAEEGAKLKVSTASQKETALKEMVNPMPVESLERARVEMLDKDEDLCELRRALVVLASASAVTWEREEIKRLLDKEMELYMMEEEVDSDEEVSEEPSDTAELFPALRDRVDAMVQKLEEELRYVGSRIGDRWRFLDRDYDGKVTPEELTSAAVYLKDKQNKDGILDLISRLPKDKDGKILVEDIVPLQCPYE